MFLGWLLGAGGLEWGTHLVASISQKKGPRHPSRGVAGLIPPCLKGQDGGPGRRLLEAVAHVKPEGLGRTVVVHQVTEERLGGDSVELIGDVLAPDGGGPAGPGRLDTQ